MNLDLLRVENFRSIECESFPLTSHTVLIGRNNAGKSNLMRAVSMLLGGTKKDVDARCFFDQGNPIHLEATFSGVAEQLDLLSVPAQRTKLKSCLLPNDTIRVRRSAPEPDAIGKLEIWQPSENMYGSPTGIDAALRRILPEVIEIAAFVDPSGEATGKATATFGKIIKLILGSIIDVASEKIEAGLRNVDAFLNYSEGQEAPDQRPASLRSVEQSISDWIADSFEGARARIKVGMPELQSLLTSSIVEIYEDGRWEVPSHKGQGLQRALYVSLLLALAKERALAGPGLTSQSPFILLVEEPEAFLHPPAHGKLRDALESISLTDQVLLATHSPTMVSSRNLRQVMLIRKLNGRTVRLPSIPSVVEGMERRISQLFQYPRSSRFLFSDAAVVVEGPADVRALNAVSISFHGKSLADQGIEPIEAENKLVVSECMSVLTSLGLPSAGVVDLDFLWNGAGRLLGADPQLSRLTEEIKAAAMTEDRMDKPRATRFLAEERPDERDAIRQRLRDDHGIWVWSGGEIEQMLGEGNISEIEHALRAGEWDLGDKEEEWRAVLEWINTMILNAPAVGN